MIPAERTHCPGTDVSAATTGSVEQVRTRGQRDEREEARLRALYASEVLDTLPGEVFDDATLLAAKLCGTPVAWLSLLDRDRLWLKSVHGADAREIPHEIASVAHAVLTPETVTVVPDLREEGRFAADSRVAGEEGFRFFAAAPLVAEEGHPLGVLGVLDRAPRRMSEDEVAALCALARQTTAQLVLRLRNQKLHASLLVREEVEHTLRQSEERFRLAWENAPIGLALVGMDGAWLKVNRVACQLLEVREDELIRQPLTALMYPDDLAGLREGLARLREGELDAWQSEVRLLSQRGGVRAVSLYASLLRDEAGGEPLHYIVELVDITSRKFFESERERLLQEERAARAAAEAEHQGSVFLVESGRAVAATELEIQAILATAAEHAVPFLGDFCLVELADAEGEPLRVGSPSDDPPSSALAAAIRSLTPGLYETRAPAGAHLLGDAAGLPGLLARTPADVETLREMRLQSAIIAPIRVDEAMLGHLLLLDLRGSHRRSAADRLVLAEGFAAHVALSVRKAQLYREAKDAIAVRDRILDIVAHDLRNPVSAINLAAEMFRSNRDDPMMAVFTIDMIQEATRRLERLIKNLLDSRSIERGHLAIERSAQDLAVLLQNLDEAMAPFAARYSVGLRFLVEQEFPTAIIDPDCIWQVLTNLLDNAIKFSPPGSEVTVHGRCSGEFVRISISDTGPGIPPEHLEKIFLPYWRAYKEPRQRGTGLGLAIAKAVVEAHQGRIWVESDLEAGSTFHVELPVQSNSPPSSEA
jgi:PAS domain S-box-containing protein